MARVMRESNNDSAGRNALFFDNEGGEMISVDYPISSQQIYILQTLKKNNSKHRFTSRNKYWKRPKKK